MNKKEMEEKIKQSEYGITQLLRELRRDETLIPVFAQELGIGLDDREYEIVKLENEDDPQLTIREDLDFVQKTINMLLDHLGLEIQVDAKKEETFSLRNKNEE